MIFQAYFSFNLISKHRVNCVTIVFLEPNFRLQSNENFRSCVLLSF